MERVESSVDIDCPVRTVNNQWTQFEEFPRFMSGFKEVTQSETTENGGDTLGAFMAHVERIIQDFKRYIEKRQVADGAWRGEIHDGRREPQTSDRRPSDAHTRQ